MRSDVKSTISLNLTVQPRRSQGSPAQSTRVESRIFNRTDLNSDAPWYCMMFHFLPVDSTIIVRLLEELHTSKHNIQQHKKCADTVYLSQSQKKGNKFLTSLLSDAANATIVTH